MNNEKARFITTSTGILRWLLEINTTEELVTFIVKERTIECKGIERPYYANDISGKGEFIFSKEQIEMFISILKPIPEEPLTIVFDSWIWIQQIMI